MTHSRRVVNGTWYEVCFVVNGEVRDVIEQSSKFAAARCADMMAQQWPMCEMIFIRQHKIDPKNQPGGSKYVVLHKMTLDFRTLHSEAAQ